MSNVTIKFSMQEEKIVSGQFIVATRNISNREVLYYVTNEKGYIFIDMASGNKHRIENESIKVGAPCDTKLGDIITPTRIVNVEIIVKQH